MTKIFKSLLLASAMMAASNGAANAQVANGIAIADPEVAIANASSLATAYQQIETQYQATLDQLEARQTAVQTLTRQLDTNNDNQLSEQEANANPTVVDQIRTENTALQEMLEPITIAQMFALQQVAAQYPTAQQQVITNKGINVILSPQSILYGPDGINVTRDIIAALNTLIPTANINVPQGWQPNRQTVALHQQIQQLRAAAFQRAAQAQAAQGQQAAAPAPDRPSGR